MRQMRAAITGRASMFKFGEFKVKDFMKELYTSGVAITAHSLHFKARSLDIDLKPQSKYIAYPKTLVGRSLEVANGDVHLVVLKDSTEEQARIKNVRISIVTSTLEQSTLLRKELVEYLDERDMLPTSKLLLVNLVSSEIPIKVHGPHAHLPTILNCIAENHASVHCFCLEDRMILTVYLGGY